jgi:hypothetical protein
VLLPFGIAPYFGTGLLWVGGVAIAAVFWANALSRSDRGPEPEPSMGPRHWGAASTLHLGQAPGTENLVPVNDASVPRALAVAAALTLPKEKRASPSFVHQRKNYDGRHDQNQDDTHAVASYLFVCSEEASGLHVATSKVVVVSKRGVAPKGNTSHFTRCAAGAASPAEPSPATGFASCGLPLMAQHHSLRPEVGPPK